MLCFLNFILNTNITTLPKLTTTLCLCVFSAVCFCACVCCTGSSSCTTLLRTVLNASYTHNDRRSVSSVRNLTQGEELHPSVLTQNPPLTHLQTLTHTHTHPPKTLYPHRQTQTTTAHSRRPLLLESELGNLC